MTNIEIPVGWEVTEFGNITSLRNKKYTPSRNENLKCIELECIEKETGILLYYLSSSTQKSTKTYFYKDDVLYGKLRPYLKKYIYAKTDGVCTTEIWVLTATKRINSYFLYLVIQLDKFNQIANISTGTRMPRADWNMVSNFLVLLPPLSEQEKIADILQTWDKAIEQTKELIAYKEKQKKGLMQQLLTGKKRLDGFSGEWKSVKLGEVLKERNIYAEKNGTYNHVSLTKDGIIQKKDKYNRDYLVTKQDKEYKITKKDDICYNPANLKFGVICKNNYGIGIFSPIYVTFEINANYNTDFIAFLLTQKAFIDKIRRYEEGTVYERKAVKPKDFLLGRISIPKSINEQKAIADILCKADEEIELLNKQLELYTEHKKGLMQNLLTGKVRVKV